MPRPAIGSAPGAGFAQSAANAGIAHRTLLASGHINMLSAAGVALADSWDDTSIVVVD